MLCDVFFFFFNDTATTEIYTLSLHDALPISDYLLAIGREDIRPRILVVGGEVLTPLMRRRLTQAFGVEPVQTDRKSTRLNSSHGYISYAVFCLKKKKKNISSHTGR